MKLLGDYLPFLDALKGSHLKGEAPQFQGDAVEDVGVPRFRPHHYHVSEVEDAKPLLPQLAFDPLFLRLVLLLFLFHFRTLY